MKKETELKEEIEKDIIEKVLNKIRNKIEKPNFKSKIEIARLSMGRLLKELKINSHKKQQEETEKIICSGCRKPIAIVSKDYEKRVLKSWISICLSCLRTLEDNYIEKIKELTQQLNQEKEK